MERQTGRSEMMKTERKPAKKSQRKKRDKKKKIRMTNG